MKMKNMLIGGMSLALVACISIGGTLAYLTSKTDTMTNEFKFGGFTITQTEEADTKATSDGEGGYIYNNVVPGDVLKKDVKISLSSTTNTNAYVYVAVKDAAADVNYGTMSDGKFVQQASSGWKEITKQDASAMNGNYKLYVYVKDKAVAEPVNNLQPTSLFTNVEVPNTDGAQSFTSGQTIQIASYAIQADNMPNHQAEAVEHFNTLFK